MIRHIVLFKFKEGVSWDDPRAVEAEKATIGLAGKIPEVQSWFVGRNITDWPISYDYALIAGLKDLEALQAYVVNTDHGETVKLWDVISSRVIADIEY